MKDFPVAVVAWQASSSRKRAFCVSFTRGQGTDYEFTVRGTSWDEDLIVDGEVYYSTSGGSLSDIDSSASLSVDNAELKANFDEITSEDLQAGLWNGAAIELFSIDPDGLSDSPQIGKGDRWIGTLGQITVDRLTFIAEWRGRLQSLQQTYGWLIGNTCVHTLGDDKCAKDLTDFTVEGTLDAISDDGLTFTDSARTEDGPAGTVDIANVTNGSPTVIDLDDSMSLSDGDAVNIVVDEPVALNGPQIVRNPSGTRFEVVLDTTDGGAFSAGTVTPLSNESGYFGYGTMELLDGDNAGKGIFVEVKWSDGANWGVQKAFPFPVLTGAAYRLVAGCDKLRATCKNKFDNLLNFLGFRAKGADWMQSIGRSE